VAHKARPPHPGGSFPRSASASPAGRPHGPLSPVPDADTGLQFRTVHGYRRAFRMSGAGPPLLLIHGIGDSSKTWLDVMPALARRHLVIAPDLLGHGASDKPRADYSVAAYANGMRDLLGVLGIDKATLVGHSLGGGVAMQFAYQFPERTARLALVATGGLGREVSPALVLASLPGADVLLSLLRLPGMRLQARLVASVLQRLDTDLGIDVPDFMRLFESLAGLSARQAFLRTLRAVVDRRGQVVTMLDRCYLARGMPTLLIWGSRDAVLPLHHAWTAQQAMPGSHLEVFEGAGHFPFHTDPARFVTLLETFMANSAPADWSVRQWRALLRTGRLADGIPATGPVQRREADRALRNASERSAT
jgi:pimeloyl-ACP methyl ester carboxylesterase